MGNLFFEGLFLQASLIFALGAQNLFVFESGLRRQNHLTVSLVCFLCDFTLIMLGVAGAATLFSQFPRFKIIIGLLGVFFLFSYGWGKVFGALNLKQVSTEDKISITLKQSIIVAFTVSVLNPHAYLDAFILIGGFSAKYGQMSDRLVVGMGAAIYSGIWFLILSTFSSYLRPLIDNPKRMRKIMVLAGCGLIFLSGKLSLDVIDWIMIELNSPQILSTVE